MKVAKIVFFSFVFATFSIPGLAAPPKLKCLEIADFKEKVCRASMLELIVTPDKYDGKLVLVDGYFADGDYPILFVDQEAYSVSRLVEAIVLDAPADEVTKTRMSNLSRANVRVLGRFSAKPEYLEDSLLGVVSGRLSEISQFGATSMPWGYQEPIPSLLRKGEERKEQ